MGTFKMQRKAVTANTEYAFKFDVTGKEFLVKNLTEGDMPDLSQVKIIVKDY